LNKTRSLPDPADQPGRSDQTPALVSAPGTTPETTLATHHGQVPVQVGTVPSTQEILPVPARRPGSGTVLTVESGSLRSEIEVPGTVVVPGYEILSQLGRGGMGVVYKARHTNLNRLVALKMILAGVHAGKEELARFHAEAEAVARLQHPNIVQIYEIGEADGKPYISLEYISGGSLGGTLKGTPLPPSHAAQIAETLGRAIHVAHLQGIVHRDLKPANILLAPATDQSSPNLTLDDRQQVFIPKISDFGLVKHLDDDSAQTQSGAVLGTPSYMAPEQATGKVKRIGPCTDVYALGAILYEMLTGRPPFRGITVVETLDLVRHQEPVPPHSLVAKLPTDLETICLKCLQKDPARRYATALDLAEDLRAFLEGRPIQARPVSAWERAAKWAKRRPAVAASLAAVVLVTALGFGLVTWHWQQAIHAHKTAEEQRQQALQALEREEQARKDRALAQIHALLTANPLAVPNILQNLKQSRDDVLPRLLEHWEEKDLPPPQLLRVGLALLPTDTRPVQLLSAGMLYADPQEMLLIRDALAPYSKQLAPELWRCADDARLNAEIRLRALAALALFDADNPRWQQAGILAVGPMLSANPLHLGQWVRAFQPVRRFLIDPLSEAFHDRYQIERRRAAASILADYAADQPALLVNLLLDAGVRRHDVVWPVVKAQRADTLPLLLEEFQKTLPPEDQVVARERQSWRRAQAAVSLLQLGETASVWPLFQHQADPTVRSFLVDRLAPLGTDPRLLIRRLNEETDVSGRRALILSLGEFTAEQLPESVRQPLLPRLLTWYENDPDPGVHAAIDWLLRHGREGPVARKLDWKHGDALRQIDQKMSTKSDDRPPSRRWYVNKQGQTMVVFPAPLEFDMGSPTWEPDRIEENERLHRRRISRTFALASKTVTVRQFQAFLDAHPEVKHHHNNKYCPDDDGPIISVTWYEAAQYCRWLSEQESIPDDQMCYPAIAEIEKCKKDREPVRLPADHLTRTGYRLPSEGEWEYACRAGARTARSCGDAEELLGKYAFYIQNSEGRTWPVGQKKPNDFGLFDMHGHVWQWCQESSRINPEGSLVDDDDGKRAVLDNLSRALRGGSFIYPPVLVRSAARYINRSTLLDSVGLRVAQTIRQSTVQ
jgi:formylglycine-generating enzyme required for sulfatase activity/tRNA A-37 threonylcarbamoyl transferase component Bud32